MGFAEMKLYRSWIRRTRRDWLGRWWAECRQGGCIYRERCWDAATAHLAMTNHGCEHDFAE